MTEPSKAEITLRLLQEAIEKIRMDVDHVQVRLKQRSCGAQHCYFIPNAFGRPVPCECLKEWPALGTVISSLYRHAKELAEL